MALTKEHFAKLERCQDLSLRSRMCSKRLVAIYIKDNPPVSNTETEHESFLCRISRRVRA